MFSVYSRSHHFLASRSFSIEHACFLVTADVVTVLVIAASYSRVILSSHKESASVSLSASNPDLVAANLVAVRVSQAIVRTRVRAFLLACTLTYVTYVVAHTVVVVSTTPCVRGTQAEWIRGASAVAAN